MVKKSYKFKYSPSSCKYRYEVRLIELPFQLGSPTGGMIAILKGILGHFKTHELYHRTAVFDSNMSIDKLAAHLHKYGVREADIIQTEYTDYELKENL